MRVGWLIDGLGGPTQSDVLICIVDDRIGSLAPYAGLADTYRPFYDLSQAAVLPAIMDTHVHLALSGNQDPQLRQAQLAYSREQTREAVAHHLIQHWQSGIVAVRDGGDPNGVVLQFIQDRRHLHHHAPVHVSATCWAWHADGRYGSMIGRTPPAGLSLEAAVAAMPGGADHLKVIQSGVNSLDAFGHSTNPQFSQAQLQAAFSAARHKGLSVMVHANGRQPVQMALRAGCNSIEHGYFMGRDNLQYMADHGIVWTPTAVPMAALARSPSLTAAQTEVARRTLDHQLEQIALGHRLGVEMVLGTDAGSQGVDHGLAVAEELGLLVSAGLPLEKAVACGTANAARLLGLPQRGALRPGWAADFIVVPGGAHELIRDVRSIRVLSAGGRWWRREALTANWTATEPGRL